MDFISGFAFGFFVGGAIFIALWRNEVGMRQADKAAIRAFENAMKQLNIRNREG